MSIAPFLVTGGQFRLHRKEQHEGQGHPGNVLLKCWKRAVSGGDGDAF
jgi:hypothetical protein